jgi:hypothetical protein
MNSARLNVAHRSPLNFRPSTIVKVPKWKCKCEWETLPHTTQITAIPRTSPPAEYGEYRAKRWAWEQYKHDKRAWT